jgi:hypothetical protein
MMALGALVLIGAALQVSGVAVLATFAAGIALIGASFWSAERLSRQGD